MLDEHPVGYVTFGDGSQAKIIGCGRVNTPGLPNLKCVYLVEGLEVSLISVSQLVDEFDGVLFSRTMFIVYDGMGKSVMGGTRSKDNCYCVSANEEFSSQVCFRSMAKENSLDLWHRRMCHLNHRDLIKLSKKGSVRGLPELSGTPTGMCEGCRQGKQTRSPHTVLNSNSTTHVLELLHMDLVGPIQTESLGGFTYILVCFDDYSRFTWIKHLKSKSETFISFRKLCKKITTAKASDNVRVVRIRTDHGTEFENSSFERFCDKYGIHHEFSAPISPQQNGVVERKNRVLVELSRSMINNADLPHTFWGEAVQTACYTLNRVVFRPGSHKTPHEIWNGKKPNIAHLKVFGSPCFIYKDRDYLEKFDAKSDKGIFLGYSTTSRAYRVYNKRTCTVMETVNVAINEVPLVPNDLPSVAEQEQVLEANEEGPVEDAETSSSSDDESEESDKAIPSSGIDATTLAIPALHRSGKRQVEKDHSKQFCCSKMFFVHASS